MGVAKYLKDLAKMMHVTQWNLLNPYTVPMSLSLYWDGGYHRKVINHKVTTYQLVVFPDQLVVFPDKGTDLNWLKYLSTNSDYKQVVVPDALRNRMPWFPKLPFVAPPHMWEVDLQAKWQNCTALHCSLQP